MFQEKVQSRLCLLTEGKDQPVELSEREFHLIEKSEGGEADLRVGIFGECILFRGLEKRKLQYFKNNKCADYVIFESGDDICILHIFELKRTVKKDEWEHIKQQFSGALQNALALAGVLEVSISLENVQLHTVYRNDKLNDAANPAVLRKKLHDKSAGSKDSAGSDWNSRQISLEFPQGVLFSHHKIKLDIENGTGEYTLCSGHQQHEAVG